MKKIAYLLLLLFSFSCQKGADVASIKDVSLEVKSNMLLSYSLGNIPTDGGNTITVKPQYAARCEIVFDTVNGGQMLVYQSVEGFKGVDKLEITRLEGVGDGSGAKQTLRFTISVK